MEQPNPEWVASLRDRLDIAPRSGKGHPLSIKVRVRPCFCRSCCPEGWNQLDAVLLRQSHRNDEFILEEHESGPEIIVYLAVTTAGLSLAKSVVDLVTAIIKARSDGEKRGDRSCDSMEVIVRSVTVNNSYREKEVWRVSDSSSLESNKIRSEIDLAITELFSDME